MTYLRQPATIVDAFCVLFRRPHRACTLASRLYSTPRATVVNSTESDPLPWQYESQSKKPSKEQPLPSVSRARAAIPQLSPRAPYNRPTNDLDASKALLVALAVQKPHYATIHIHARPYLVTLGDSIRLPFHMPDVTPGTTIRLDRASVLGSRDFTFRGNPWIDETFFICRATVIGVENEPMHVTVRERQRNRRSRTTRNKMRTTILRISELQVFPHGNPEAGDQQ